jgi:hypothetical protein
VSEGKAARNAATGSEAPQVNNTPTEIGDIGVAIKILLLS